MMPATMDIIIIMREVMVFGFIDAFIIVPIMSRD